MPLTKLATIRYQALDRCFRNRNQYFYIDDLVRAVNEMLIANCETPVSKRTVYKDITAMLNNEKWQILFEEPAWHNGRRYYRYEDPNFSIWHEDLSKEQLIQLKSILIMLHQFRGLPQWEVMRSMIDELEEKYQFQLDYQSQIVDFDQNQYVYGLEWLSLLYQAIVEKQVLEVSYQPFGKVKEKHIIHPYFLKQYNSRWFLFGKTDEAINLTNFALDRIKSVDKSTLPYEQAEISMSEYFEDFIGVSTKKEHEVEHVVLRFTSERLPYVLSKPIHESQKNNRKDEGIVELDVKINKELRQIILSFGKDVEVLSPDCLRLQIAKEVLEMQKKYFST